MKIETLIEKVKAGDAKALKMMYNTYSPMMRGVCINITKEDEVTIDDLVQDAFILAYSSLDKLKNPQKFREWLIAITKNVSLRHLERKKRQPLTSISSCLNEVMEVADTLSSDSLFYFLLFFISTFFISNFQHFDKFFFRWEYLK